MVFQGYFVTLLIILKVHYYARKPKKKRVDLTKHYQKPSLDSGCCRSLVYFISKSINYTM